MGLKVDVKVGVKGGVKVGVKVVVKVVGVKVVGVRGAARGQRPADFRHKCDGNRKKVGAPHHRGIAWQILNSFVTIQGRSSTDIYYRQGQ